MADTSAASEATREPMHQQGMSPTLEGEDQGPSYGRSSVPLRQGPDAGNPVAPSTMPNGVFTGTATVRDDPVRLSDGAVEQSRDMNGTAAVPRQLPVMGTGQQQGAVFTPTGDGASVHVGLASERERPDMRLPLFPRFNPSPLPGQSPMTTRADARQPSWFSRLGDYIQRRVEVTAWSTPPALGTPATGMWQNETRTMMVSSPHAVEQRPESNSSGSAGISQELLQAEVSRQLDQAMGEVMARLQEERRKTEEATDEAQRLRVQLEALEMRTAQQPLALEAPPGLVVADREGHGVPNRDLSDTSLQWWQETMKDALAWYSQYAASSPLARLQLQPKPSAELRPEWARVERRGSAMMLSAIPKTIREEIIAHGEVTALVVLCKLYAVYQPGNLQEKTLVLKMLEMPEECTSALQAVEGLRRWSLWRRRAATLGMAEPDPSVLVRGLDRITAPIITGSGELAFRVSLIRSTLQVDVSPSSSTVTSFLQHLQAEMEQQARLGSVKPELAPGMRAMTATPELQALQQQPPQPTSTPTSPTPPKAGSLCKFFSSDKGCRRGNACRYPHTWALLEKGARQRKCLCCGSTQHKVKECRAPGGGQATPKSAGRNNPIGASDTGATTSTTSPTETAARKVNFEGLAEAQVKVMRVLQKVQQLEILKPVVNAINKWSSSSSPTTTPRSKDALLDSGATHILRRPRDEVEWTNARDVNVQLAGDSCVTMKQTCDGTLLSGEDLAQVIVPLGRVISTLGYRLHWTKDYCELLGVDGEVLPLRVVKGCPELPEATAARLIHELETKQLPELMSTTETSIKAICERKLSWWAHMIEYVKCGSTERGRRAVDKAEFLGYKDDVKGDLVIRQPRPGIWDLMKQLTLNRRTRKRLLRCSSWIIRWDPPAVERRSDELRHLAYVGSSVYVNVNTMLVENALLDVWKVLWWAAVQGRIDDVVARDATQKPLEQLAAAPHRDRVHYLHALASAGRSVRGGDAVRLYVEEDPTWALARTSATTTTSVPWSQSPEAVKYVCEMGLRNPSVEKYSGDHVVRLAKMDSDTAWKLHVMRNHTPYRRDCSVCVRNAATGKQHRATLHPTAYTLSVDIAGPIKGHGLSPDGKHFRFFLVGAFRLPVVEGGIGRDDELHGHSLPAEEEMVEESDELSDEDGEPREVGIEEEIPDYDPEELRKEKEEWERLKAKFKEPLKTETLYFCVPVNGKKAIYTLPAIQQMITEIKSLGFPVARVHSDRGGEFRGNLVKRWLAGQGIMRTTSTGSEPAENGVAEAGVRYLKRRARTLLDAGGLPRVHWPTAIQTAAVQQRCWKLGIRDPTPVAYGAKVYVKVKKYKTGDVESFTPHWLRGRYLGPSTDVRGGHVILKPSGTFLTTTHVRVTTDPPPLDQVAPTIVVDPEEREEPPLPPPSSPPEDEGKPTGPPDELPLPKVRVRGKAPALRQLQQFLPMYVHKHEIDLATTDEDSLEPRLCVLQPSQVCELETMVTQMLKTGTPTVEGVAAILGKVDENCGNLKTPRSKNGRGLLLGAYVHGGSFGMTNYGKMLPWTSFYINKALSTKLKETLGDGVYTWSTIALQLASEVPMHKDSHNEKDSRNYVMEVKCHDHAGLWVQDDGDECGVVGGEQRVDHQWCSEDGVIREGCLVNIKNVPAHFNPRLSHAYLKDQGEKWFISAYTPHGFHRLSEADKSNLESCGFPIPELPPPFVGEGPGTRPALKACLFPQVCEGLDGVRLHKGDVEAAVGGVDDDETCGEWGIYVEEEDKQMGGECCLRKVCDSLGPIEESDLLWRTTQAMLTGYSEAAYQQDLADCAEDWVGDTGCLNPKLFKMEPEFTPEIEDLIRELMKNGSPLRHTHNVNPQEVRQAMDKWRPAIEKELRVVEKGFYKSTAQKVEEMKASYKVQELPAKLVYTLKPPAAESELHNEAGYCKRKARIVCCGNYASEEEADIFASGAAAESLRSCLTYSAWQRWTTGLLDIAGAFMLTPLPQGPDEIVYAIRPPSILQKLGLVEESERWILTHGMYGLRQSPKLWAEFRDRTIQKFRFEAEGKTWMLKQGDTEPNLWALVQVERPEGEPGVLVLIYVDDILLVGRLPLLRAVAARLSETWKTTELEILTELHGIRFLGCEILTTASRDRYYLHQQPYIKEILRAHDVPPSSTSPIQAPKHLVTFEAEEEESKGEPHELKLAQRLCGELLWLAQRTRPDVSFTVNAMGALISRAAPRCIQVGMRLLAYLQHTQEYALVIYPVSEDLVTFTDSSYAPEGRRSHSGVLVTWKGAPLSWRATRTPYVCLSTAESELTAAIEGLKMTLSLGAVLEEITRKDLVIHLAVDNQSAIAIAKPTGSTSWRTRHLRVRAAFIREQVQLQKVIVKYVKGQNQLADLLTKTFPRQRLEELVTMWGMGKVCEGAKTTMLKAMILCTLIQSVRAQDEHQEPLALDTAPLELYVVVVVACIVVVGLWEFVWLCVDRCCTRPGETRAARRMRRLREAVQRELDTQIRGLDEVASPTPPPTPAPATTSTPQRSRRRSTASASTSGPPSILGTPERARPHIVDAATQTTLDEDYVPIVEYLTRDVPVPVPVREWHPGPLFVSPHGDTFHTVENCWGLRNTKSRSLRFCQCCRENQGRSLRER
eukprot:s115_g11.t1